MRRIRRNKKSFFLTIRLSALIRIEQSHSRNVQTPKELKRVKSPRNKNTTKLHTKSLNTLFHYYYYNYYYYYYKKSIFVFQHLRRSIIFCHVAWCCIKIEIPPYYHWFTLLSKGVLRLRRLQYTIF